MSLAVGGGTGSPYRAIMTKRIAKGLPSREQILEFITNSDQPAGKREIARAFALSGADKIALKALLKDMADEGLIDSAPGRAFHRMGGLPKVTVLKIVDVEDDQVIGVPENWQADGVPLPRLRVVERGRKGALGVGDRILARTEERGGGHIAHPMKKLARGEDQMLGILAEVNGKFWLRPVDKRIRRETPISDAGGAAAGQLVLAERSGRGPRVTARVTEVLGDPFAPKSFSLIAISKLGIPDHFPDSVIDEAERVAKQPLGDREDLRHLPIVAIDPVDARDHDDAVWASPRDDGGFDAVVAIADVSFYVRPGSALDKEARKRGNSVYFPDQVVPMLPHELSSDMCSLKQGVDRAALACHLVIEKSGKVKSHRFSRAVVRVAANIAYEKAQALIDDLAPLPPEGGAAGRPVGKVANVDTPTPNPSRKREGDVILPALQNLWACWALLYKARNNRAPLALDLPERRVLLDDQGRIASVAVRETIDANRLIEDFMIAANVAAAKALEAKKAPVMYRDHEPPAREKLVALKDYLETLDIPFALGQVITPATFNHILSRVENPDHRPQVMEQVLRTQTQAYYAPANTGHFGLALGSYAHFTSPIRRYADLVVHRALVAAYKLGDGGLPVEEAARMSETATHISMCERRAMEAERDTVDRYVAAYLGERVGQIVATRITGVTKFGFFATIEGLGGDGLVPVSSLGDEYFRFDETSLTLVGEHSGETFATGQRLDLKLAEADPVSGALRFEIPGMGRGRRPSPRPVMGRRGRPKGIRHR
jgi:ribonuclease R